MIKLDANIQNELLNKRYGEYSIPEEILWNEQIESLLNHKTVRNFLPEPLAEGTIQTMVAAAQSASNSSNLNQWSVIAITDNELKAKIAETSREGSKFGMGNPYIEQAPVLLLWVADMHRNKKMSEAQGFESVVLNSIDAVLMSAIDTSIAAQNAVVAAESLDLGVVYLGAMRNNAKRISDLLNLPDYTYIVFGMLVGKPDPNKEHSIRPRLSQKAVLHFNGYDNNIWESEVDAYEGEFQKFRKENNMKKKTWKESIHFSTGNMDYMDGREKFRAYLEDRGLKAL
ncbi:NADPH-dependent oxidoreductase [Chishuiella changwenlii]|jgi:nitroreductase|uniref:NADPH-dependent oxidoreductase n=1 Tax=Chishuiella changwenlii TaxID=1434701 RepID=UPI002FDB3FBF